MEDKKQLITYEELAQERAGYVCDERCLEEIKSSETFNETRRKLTGRIEKIFDELVLRNMHIEKFYIGKSSITAPKSKDGKRGKKEKKRAEGGENDDENDDENDAEVDLMKPNTWKKDNIGKRWNKYITKGNAKNGLIVIAAVQDNQVSDNWSDSNDGSKSHRAYTLKLESSLIEHYQRTDFKRLANEIVDNPGGDDKNPASVLYIAFTSSKTIQFSSPILLVKEYSIDLATALLEVKIIDEFKKKESYGNKIKKFYIVKERVPKQQNTELDSLDQKTWNKDLLQKKWSLQTGMNGLIVLTVIQKDEVPDGSKVADNGKEPHDAYTLALKERLVQRYTMEKKDERCKNTIDEIDESTTREGCEGYAIYVLFNFC